MAIKGKLQLRWRPIITVRKRDDAGNVYETIRCEGNLLTTAGMNRILSRFTSDTSAALSADSVRIGVGDSAEAESISDTSLAVTTDQWYQVLDPGYPIVSTNTAEYQATFGASDANFTWACWGIDVDDAWDESPGLESSDTPAELFNRKVFNFGTKSGGIWDVSVVISFEG